MENYSYLRVLSFVLLLMFSFSLILCGCTQSHTTAPPDSTQPSDNEQDSIQIDWTMYGTWITEDGETGQKEDFSINGAITEQNPGMDVLAIDISFQSTFRYSYQDQQSPFYSGSRQYFELPYYVCQCYSWDSNRADFVFSYFALSAQQEYAIFYWENYPIRFFVASKDPNADPAEILTYFEDFIVKYNLS